MKLDERTFGDSPAAITLAKLINESGVKSHKISRLLNHFNLTLKELGKIDTKVSIGTARVVYENYKKSCETIPAPFSTYTANVLNTKYKCWLKENKGQVPYKIRKDK